ncbi:hypothetical protein [Roseateles cavernae]|uniref:hypothetical protein n=1 Tax=Roseateles cavernae TaxID=3153578 RepID=UPI0032E4032A
MGYPSIEQYQEILQNPQIAFTDPQLARGRIRTNGMLGTPAVASGGFALTYGVEVDGKKFAVRCFHREAKDLEKRYAAVSKKLQSLGSSYFVDFEYQARGIKANGSVFPLVKMAWASGDTLGAFVEAHHADKAKLTNLRTSLEQLAQELEKMGIAHGDIQEGNLMVSEQGRRLQLIDYDGMYVPELASMGSAELGHRDFQHPGRDAKRYDSRLDRFSFIALNLALRALCERPAIWNSSQSGSGVIVLKANDFADPGASATLADIGQVPALQRDAKNFASICRGGFQEIPSLAEFLAGTNIPQQIVALGTSREPTQQPVGYISQFPVVSGSDYAKFAAFIGSMVELVGQVTQVRTMRTRYGKPMTFINLGTYPGCVSLTLWSDALATHGEQPDTNWNGRWISIRGLVEPPNKKQKHPAAFIQVSSLSQIHRLTEKDAKYRLNSKGAPAGQTSSRATSNAELLAGMQTRPSQSVAGSRSTTTARGRGSAPAPAPAAPMTANQRVLEAMRQQSAAAGAPAQRPSSSAPQGSAHSPHRQTHTPPPTPTKSVPGWVWVVGAIVAFSLLRALLRN